MPAGIIDRLRGNPLIRLVANEAKKRSEPVYLVGGAIRDAALRLSPALDVDVAVGGAPKPFADKLARRLKAACFLLHDATQVYRVAVKGKKGAQIDVARLQGRDIRADLARRDFTINAMALKLPIEGDGLFLDPFAGLKDLKAGVLRATAAKVFADDPIRLLRAYRLASCFGFRIEKNTEKAIGKHARKISKCAGERVRTELLGILSGKNAADRLRAMDASGLLTAVFRELEVSRECAVAYYGKGGVLKHSLNVVERMDQLLAGLDAVYPRHCEAIRKDAEGLSGDWDSHGALLRLAALLHDVAKPACAKKIGGRLRFFGHEARGARMSSDILRRLRFSAKETALVSDAVRHHLRPGNLAAGRIISDKAVYRFFRDLGSHGISLLLLCWADHASYLPAAALKKLLTRIHQDPMTSAARGKPGDTHKTLFHLQVVTCLINRYFERPETLRPERILSGNDVMKALRLKPGPRIGEILRALQEAQAVGRVRSRADALRFIRLQNQAS